MTLLVISNEFGQNRTNVWSVKLLKTVNSFFQKAEPYYRKKHYKNVPYASSYIQETRKELIKNSFVFFSFDIGKKNYYSILNKWPLIFVKDLLTMHVISVFICTVDIAC